MIATIKRLEKIALLLEPDAVYRSQTIEKVISYSENFLENIDNLPSYKFTEHKGIEIYTSPIQNEAGRLNGEDMQLD